MPFPWFTRSAAPASAAPAPAEPETRAASIFDGQGFASLAAMAGGTPRPGEEGLSALVACVNAISGSLASLPCLVYRDSDAGRIEQPNHPFARLVRIGPNSRQTWPDWLEWTMGQVLLRGNALSLVERDARGTVTGLTPVPWGSVQVSVLPSGRIAYDVVASASAYGGPATAKRYLDHEVFHLRDRSDDGVVGRSRVSRAPGVIDAAIGLQAFSAAVWDNAATPSGILTAPAGITEAGLNRLRTVAEARHAGARNAKRVMVVDKDTTFTPMSISPEDSEVLASRRFTTEEICRLMGVPPIIVADLSRSAYNTASQASLAFAVNCLTPWARKIEAVLARSVLDEHHHATIDLSGLVRGDFSTRWAANEIAIRSGAVTVNEIREAEGYSPLPEPALIG